MAMIEAVGEKRLSCIIKKMIRAFQRFTLRTENVEIGNPFFPYLPSKTCHCVIDYVELLHTDQDHVYTIYTIHQITTVGQNIQAFFDII